MSHLGTLAGPRTDAPQRISGHDPRDMFSANESPDVMSALNQDLRGLRIAYSPDLGAFPVEDSVSAAAHAFIDAGATVEEVAAAMPFVQLELAELWHRLVSPLNLSAAEGLRTVGINLLGSHRDSIPEGLPVGMQIIGDRYDDAGVLAAANVFEQIRPWSHLYQACSRD